MPRATSSPSGNFFGSSEVVKLPLSPGTYRVTVSARNYAPQTITMSSPSQQTVRFSPGGTIILHSRDTATRRFRLVDTSGTPFGMNPSRRGSCRSPRARCTLNNIAAGHYRLEVLDKNDKVTKTVEIDVVDGQQKDYDV